MCVCEFIAENWKTIENVQERQILIKHAKRGRFFAVNYMSIDFFLFKN